VGANRVTPAKNVTRAPCATPRAVRAIVSAKGYGPARLAEYLPLGSTRQRTRTFSAKLVGHRRRPSKTRPTRTGPTPPFGPCVVNVHHTSVAIQTLTVGPVWVGTKHNPSRTITFATATGLVGTIKNTKPPFGTVKALIVPQAFQTVALKTRAHKGGIRARKTSIALAVSIVAAAVGQEVTGRTDRRPPGPRSSMGKYATKTTSATLTRSVVYLQISRRTGTTRENARKRHAVPNQRSEIRPATLARTTTGLHPSEGYSLRAVIAQVGTMTWTLTVKPYATRKVRVCQCTTF